MQVQTTKESLSNAMALVIGAADTRGIVPILGTVLLKAQGSGELSMLCSDTNVLNKAITKGNVHSGGEAAVDVRRFYDLIRAVPDTQAIKLGLEAGNKTLTVESGRSRFRLPALPADSYPRMVAAFEDQVTVTLSTQRLAAMLADVSEAMGDNNMRPYLNGAIFSLDMEGLWIAATDEYRLMVAHEPINLGDKKLCRSCILPRKAILLAKKLLVQGGDVQLSLGSKNIQFTFDGGNVLFSKTVEGNYPDWRLAIPSRQNTVTVNALDLSDALAMLITAVDDALSMKGLKNALQVSIGNTAMTLRRGESGVCNIDCRNETQSACEFMVNICFLSDSMRTLKTHSEQSIIGFSSSECAITVRPKGSDYPLSVIMPIKK